MKKIIVFVTSVILTMGAAGCTDHKFDTNACTSADSIEGVVWIEELKESMTNCTCEISIIKGTYEGQAVIFIALTDPVCNGIDTPTLYNCEGKEVRSFTTSAADQKELREKVTRDTVMYRCKI